MNMVGYPGQFYSRHQIYIIKTKGGKLMNTYLFYYNGFCEAEVASSLMFLEKKAICVSLEDRVYVSEEGQKFVPDKTVDDVNPDDVDLFIIPGGAPNYLFDNEKLKNFILELDKKEKYIAAICGGPYLLASYGVLDGRRCTGNGSGIVPGSKNYDLFKNAEILSDSIVKDGNIITAVGSAFVELAVELYGILNLYKNEKDREETYNWFKNIR